MMTKYKYFPPPRGQRIKTLLLDANVTAHLDTIYRRGQDFTSNDVRCRMEDLVGKVASDVMVMPGLGAGEGVLRRNETYQIENYRRRSDHAFALFAEDCKGLRAWLSNSFEGETPLQHRGLSDQQLPALFEVMRENLIYPSYALLLKAYQLYLNGAKASSSIRELADFSAELYGRGSPEVMLGALLILGNSRGREMALNIMKLREPKGAAETLANLWNTCFDLTYSRIAVMPSIPELSHAFKMPCVFVTDDKHLGRLLEIIQPADAVAVVHGGGVTASFAHLGGLLSEENYRLLADVVARGNIGTYNEPTNLELLTRIRRFKAKKYIDALEDWFNSRD